MWELLRYAGLGIVGYITPRVLVGVGVPLDEWGIAIGTWLGTSEPWAKEWGLTVIGLVVATIFITAEAWWHPLRRLFTRKNIETSATNPTEGNASLTKGDPSSHFQMTVGESGPYLSINGRLYSFRRTLSVKVENVDRGQSLSSCIVRVMSIEPETEHEGPWLLKDGFSLAAGDHIFVPLVSYGEARDQTKFPCGDTFATMGTERGHPFLNVGTEYTVTLRATATETAFCDFQCKIWVDETGRLRIAALGIPVAEAPKLAIAAAPVRERTVAGAVPKASTQKRYLRQTRAITEDYPDGEWGPVGDTPFRAVTIVDRDVWLMDALRFIITGEWEGDDFPKLSSEHDHLAKLGETIRDVQQAAFDGKLPVWGMKVGSPLQEPIPAADWRELRIDWWTALAGKTWDLELKAPTAYLEGVVTYTSPKTSKAKVEELWPKANT